MRKLTSTQLTWTTVLFLAVLVAGAAPAPAQEPETPPAPAYVPGEVLVGLDNGREKVVQLPADESVPAAAADLRDRTGVSYAIPNYIAHTAGVPDDPGLFANPGDWRRTQWNFLPCGSLCNPAAPVEAFQARGGINAPAAWATLKQRKAAGGSGVKVAVLDTGVAFANLKPTFKKSPDFARDQFVRGRDFVDGGKNGKKPNKFHALPLDRDGHGTHVTGTIAERTGNGFGLTGLVPKATIIPVRVLDAQGFGTARDISAGIRYAAKAGADAINMSFEFAAGVDSCSKIKSVCNALKVARKHNVVVAAAAGNSVGAPVAFPAGAPHVIGVGRSTKDGCLANDSRTGGGLDLLAPGGGRPINPACGADDPLFKRGDPIFQLTFDGPGFRSFGYPRDYEGTSMATAHVTGVAAMVIASRVLGKHPTEQDVECQLETTARKTNLGEAYDPVTFGAGVLDAAAAVSARAPGC